MITCVSEIVERKLYPRILRFNGGEVLLELSTLDKKLLESGFYLPKLPPVKESELFFVNLDALKFDVMPLHQPAGFIFHLGRCGSTATVKMLNSLENYQVISEAMILHLLATAQKYKPIDDRLERRKKLVDLFCLLGDSENSKTIFKLASWEVRLCDEYSKLYPEVNRCLIVRDIQEIMVAMLKDPPLRLRRSRTRKLLEEERSKGRASLLSSLTVTFGTEIDYFSNQPYVDFIGHAIKGLLDDVKNSTDPYLIIDHRDIVRRVPTDLCELFGITPDKQQINIMRQQASYNSKSKDLNERYNDDSSRKAAEATPETRRWCESILQPMLDDIVRKNTR